MLFLILSFLFLTILPPCMILSEPIDSQPVLRIAAVSDWYPYIYFDEASGTYQGVSAELLDGFAKQEGLRLKYIPAESYAESVELLLEGKADISAFLFGQSLDSSKEESITLIHYLTTQSALIYHKDTVLSNLTKPTFANVSGYDQFSKFDLDPTKYPRQIDCINAVRNGNVDLMFCDIFAAELLMERYAYRDLKTITIPMLNVEIGFACSSFSSFEYKHQLQQYIETISETDISAMVLLTTERLRSPHSILDFIYRYPFEILCSMLAFTATALFCGFLYMRVQLRQRQAFLGYEEGYRVLSETFGEACIEYDCQQDTFSLFSEQENHIDLDAVTKSFRERLREQSLRLSLSEAELDSILNQAQTGKSIDATFQCGIRNGGWMWYRLIYTLICTEESHRRPLRLIGCLVNIEAEHQEKEKLLQLGRNDHLTGLLSRSAAEQMIDSILQEDCSLHQDLLLFLDIDYFKQFNDTLGHLAGDDVLRTFGQMLRKVFHKEEILCRWGGDEFLLYLKNIGDEKIVIAKLEELRDLMRHYQYQDRACPVTLSIGAARAFRGVKREVLIQKADEALYLVKKQGRDGYCIDSN